MSDAANDWTAALNETLLKAVGLRQRDVYRSIQAAAAVAAAIKLRREKINTAKPGDAEADEKNDEQIFLGAMMLLAARTKRGK